MKLAELAHDVDEIGAGEELRFHDRRYGDQDRDHHQYEIVPDDGARGPHGTDDLLGVHAAPPASPRAALMIVSVGVD